MTVGGKTEQCEIAYLAKTTAKAKVLLIFSTEWPMAWVFVAGLKVYGPSWSVKV